MIRIRQVHVDAESRDGTIDELSTLVHEMAAVAWDRDSPTILNGREVREDLRFLILSWGASAHTGDECVAVWEHSDSLLRWRPVWMTVDQARERHARAIADANPPILPPLGWDVVK